MRVFFFDAETNGLWGETFTLSTAVYENGKLTVTFVAYLGPDGVTNIWVQDNARPNQKDSPRRMTPATPC